MSGSLSGSTLSPCHIADARFIVTIDGDGTLWDDAYKTDLSGSSALLGLLPRVREAGGIAGLNSSRSFASLQAFAHHQVGVPHGQLLALLPLTVAENGAYAVGPFSWFDEVMDDDHSILWNIRPGQVTGAFLALRQELAGFCRDRGWSFMETLPSLFVSQNRKACFPQAYGIVVFIDNSRALSFGCEVRLVRDHFMQPPGEDVQATREVLAFLSQFTADRFGVPVTFIPLTYQGLSQGSVSCLLSSARKGSALQALLRQLAPGVPIYHIGNGYSDQVLAGTGRIYSIAVANAVPELRQAAWRVTEQPWALGVAEALRHILSGYWAP
ncbi:HAD family hydrolase [Patescibacteria group bacterium]